MANNQPDKARRTPDTKHGPINIRKLHLDELAKEGRDPKVRPEPIVTIVEPEEDEKAPHANV